MRASVRNGKQRSRRRKRAGKRIVRTRKRSGGATAQSGPHPYDEGYDSGHTAGYGKGFENGIQKGSVKESSAKLQEESYQTGYRKGETEGRYEGGEAIVDRLMPPYGIMPDTSLEEIIAAGIAANSGRVVTVMSPEQVADRINGSLTRGLPLSVVRLGDGELLTLAQETVMPIEIVRQQGSFLPYAGVEVPNLAIRDQLREAVKQADIVGIPMLRQPNYLLLAGSVLHAHGIDIRSRVFTDSLINYGLYKGGLLKPLLQGRRVLLVGNKADQLAAVLTNAGIVVTGIVMPVNGVQDADRAVQEAQGHDFDIALVSAGVAAVLIAEKLARTTGKVAIDFGHMADAIAKGEAPL
ncbi:GT-D fold domain-containing glycosyltransferase [Paenibacillus sp. NPDC058071]|uniref:GT-D fold domain-containing protein n=1 Tax=Paenibacillus sp. NPDC058071 TaxID=3346326 RepID=UPI0036DA5FBE